MGRTGGLWGTAEVGRMMEGGTAEAGRMEGGNKARLPPLPWASEPRVASSVLPQGRPSSLSGERAMSGLHLAGSPEEARGSQGSPTGSQGGWAQSSQGGGDTAFDVCPLPVTSPISGEGSRPLREPSGRWHCAGLRGCGGRPLFPQERKLGPREST